MTWKEILPPLQWGKAYSSRMLRQDAFAGLTLAAYAIPVSMAYASLAGLPVQYGIYGYLIGGLFYALFGTSKQLAIGPTSAISLLIGTTIASMANGDVQRWAEIASLTALVMALLCLFAYLLRLSSIINFISESVLMGFKAGAAITIALTQLPKLLGLPGGGSDFFERVGILFGQLAETNLAVLFFGLSVIALLVAGERFLPGRPMAILLVVASVIIMSGTSWSMAGFSFTGNVPPGLPELRMPSFRLSDVEGIIPLAFACFLLAYIEGVSAARTLASQHGYEIDPRQELLGLAAANAATAFGQGYPVSGGLSQSAVNSKAGAKTPLSLVFASIAIAICLLFFTGPLKKLPDVMLAAILLVAISGLIDVRGLKHRWKVSRVEFVVAMIALAGVIVLGILQGVILAAIVSILLLLRAVSDPHVAFLGRIPGTKRYTDIGRHPDNETIPGLLILRVESSLFYFNIENIRKNILSEIQAKQGTLRCVIWDFSTSPSVDIAGARLIKKLYLELKAIGISLKVAETRAGVRDMLRSEELEELLGHISRKVSVDDLVSEATNGLPASQVND
jgi:high affinity sulfate transporter 1